MSFRMFQWFCGHGWQRIVPKKQGGKHVASQEYDVPI